MKRSWLALVLALALCLGLLPLASLAADEPMGDEPAKVITSGLQQWWDLTTQGADHFVATDFAADCAYFLNDAPSGENDVKAAARKRGTVVEVYTNANGEISAVKAYEYTAAIVEGDVVLVCKLDLGNGAYHYTQEKAEKITGKVNYFSSKGVLTINGVGYQASEQKVEDDVSEFRVSKALFANWYFLGGSLTDDYNFYLDKNGSIIAITSLNPSMELSRVCMVTDASLQSGSWDGKKLAAELLFLDGTTEWVAVTKLGDQSVVEQPTQAVDQIALADARQALGTPKTKVFRYHASSVGYELTELNAAEASGSWEDPVSLGDGSATVATIAKESRFAKAPNSTFDLAGWDITADHNTTFFLSRRSRSNNVVYNVYRDFRNVPEMDVTMMTAICANTSDGLDTVARFVYLETGYEQIGNTPEVEVPNGYVFICSNELILDPQLADDGVYLAKVMDVDGKLTTLRVTGALADAIAADSLVIQEPRGYVGHFFSVDGMDKNGVVSSLTNGAVPPAEKAVALDDLAAMGNGVITLAGNATYEYDAQTRFVCVDMGWRDGEQADNKFNVLEPDKDHITFYGADTFNPENFFDPSHVGPDPNTHVYTSVRTAVIPSATDKSLAGSVYVLRTQGVPADPLPTPDVTPSATPSSAPSTKPSESPMPNESVKPSESAEPSTSPSTTPSATPSTAPSTTPSTGGGGSSGGGGGSSSGGGGGGSGSTPTTTTPTTPSATPSDKPSAQPSTQPSATPSKPASEVFSDVAKDSWYEAGVTFVIDKGLFQGVAQGQFAPQQNMTRAMLMTVLARLDGQSTEGGDTWYSKAMEWAKDQGISDGTAPNDSVTREQLVTMLYRYAKATQVSEALGSFIDAASVSPWATEAMTWAVDKGILTGKDGARLDPQGTATRAEVATILQRFVEKS